MKPLPSPTLLCFLDYPGIQASNLFFGGAGKGQVGLTSVLKGYLFPTIIQGKMQQVLSVIDPFLPTGAEWFHESSLHFL